MRAPASQIYHDGALKAGSKFGNEKVSDTLLVQVRARGTHCFSSVHLSYNGVRLALHPCFSGGASSDQVPCPSC